MRRPPPSSPLVDITTLSLMFFCSYVVASHAFGQNRLSLVIVGRKNHLLHGSRSGPRNCAMHDGFEVPSQHDENRNLARVFYVDFVPAAVHVASDDPHSKNGYRIMPTVHDGATSAAAGVHFVDARSIASGADGFEAQQRQQQQDEAARKTWNWCRNFVARYNLCPWAAGSVETAGAIRIYTVTTSTTEAQESKARMQAIVSAVAQDFLKHLKTPNTDIAFVVFVPSTTDAAATSWYNHFESFYEWFVDFEEEWNMQNDDVTLAPFHPEWTYSLAADDGDDDDNAVVQLEKQSPFPTISLVSTDVIEAAGAQATEQIADHNQEILQQKTMMEWKMIYDAAVNHHTGHEE